MSDNVYHPKHYAAEFNSRPIECIEITRHLDFDLGNAFKYIWRAGNKGNLDKALEDVAKAEWYLNDAKRLMSHGSDMAIAIFDMIEKPYNPLTLESARYDVLYSILHSSFVCGPDIAVFKSRLKKSFEENNEDEK